MTKIIYVLFFLPLIGHSQTKDITELKGPYLGQKPPGMTPEIFAPGIISTTDFFEFTNVFSPDCKEFYFSRRIENKDYIFETKLTDKGWTNPERSPLFKEIRGFEPFISQDGNRIYFTFFGLPEGVKMDENLSPRDMEALMVNIWVIEKKEGKWSKPEFCINGMYVSVSNNSNIYTTSIGEKENGVCKYEYNNGKYGEKEYLNGGVNYPNPGAHPFISPDESFIIFDSKRDVHNENADLFVCYKNSDGTWSNAISFGEQINTSNSEICAIVSPDGKYIFYQSKGDIYWVDAKIIEKLKPKNI